MTNTFKEILVGCAAFSATLSFADTTFKATVNFENPNGCRAYDRVVDPDCDGATAPARCDAALKTLKALGPELQKTRCARLHEGSTGKRIIDELFMGSSYDGYKLVLSGQNAKPSQTLETSSQSADAGACADALAGVNALVAQGLKASAVCDANELRVHFGE